METKHALTTPTQRTGDSLSRDLAVLQFDARHDLPSMLAGGPLDAPNEIGVGGVVARYCNLRGYAAFTYREPV